MYVIHTYVYTHTKTDTHTRRHTGIPMPFDPRSSNPRILKCVLRVHTRRLIMRVMRVQMRTGIPMPFDPRSPNPRIRSPSVTTMHCALATH
jgi:hypothetical protein